MIFLPAIAEDNVDEIRCLIQWPVLLYQMGVCAEIMHPALPAAPTAPPRTKTRQTSTAHQADLRGCSVCTANE